MFARLTSTSVARRAQFVWQPAAMPMSGGSAIGNGSSRSYFEQNGSFDSTSSKRISSDMRRDLKSLLEFAAREHVHSKNSARQFSFEKDKRPSAVWVIESEEGSSSTPNHHNNSWKFKQVSGTEVPCDFDTEYLGDRK